MTLFMRDMENLNKGRAEGRAEGRVEGRAEGRAELTFKLVQNGKLSVTDATEELELSEAEFISRMAAAGYKIPEMV